MSKYDKNDKLADDKEEMISNTFSSFQENEYNELDFDDVERKKTVLDKKSASGPLKKSRKKISLLYDMVKENFAGNFSISAINTSIIIGTLLYIISPVDIIPDFIPVMGLTDDAAILTTCLLTLKKEIRRYQEWEKTDKAMNKK